MTRKLPWIRDSKPAPHPSPTPRTPVARQRSKAEKRNSDTDSKDTPTPVPPSSKKSPGRAPRNHRFGSTSPPPEPLQESFMIEGLEHDDGFRMVEDEFLAMAQQFTAHLHAVEYQRLKEVAASQNAETIRQISRPVVGSKTELVKKKHERAERLKKQKETRQRLLLNKATEREYSDESSGTDDAGDLLPRNTSLYGLMASPRKKAPRLDSIPGISLGPRTAAGPRAVTTSRSDAPVAPSFDTRPPRGYAPPILDMDDDSDDLEAPGRHLDSRARPSLSEQTARPSMAKSDKHTASFPQAAATNRTTPASSTVSTVSARQVHPAKTQILTNTGDTTPAYNPQRTTIEPEDQTDSDSDDDPFGGIKNRLARRVSGNCKQHKPPSDTKPTSSSRDYMPGFL